MQLPEEHKYQYPDLMWNDKARCFSARIDCKLFKQKVFDLYSLDYLNYHTYANFQHQSKVVHERQHEALVHFLQNQEHFRQLMEGAIVDYFATEVKRLLEPDEYAELLQKRINETVLLHHVHLPYSEGETIIGFEFECDWDVEHGMGIKFTNNSLSEIGMADVAF